MSANPARELYPPFMLQDPTAGADPVPYRPPSALPLPAWFDPAAWPHFADRNLVNAIYRCQRCGTCVTTDPCTSMMYGDGSEVYTPRGRISLIRALLEGRIGADELSAAAIDAVNVCIYCDNCSRVCMVNQAWVNGLAEEPNIPNATLYDAYRKTLADLGVPGVKDRPLAPPPGGWRARARRGTNQSTG